MRCQTVRKVYLEMNGCCLPLYKGLTRGKRTGWGFFGKLWLTQRRKRHLAQRRNAVLEGRMRAEQ